MLKVFRFFFPLKICSFCLVGMDVKFLASVMKHVLELQLSYFNFERNSVDCKNCPSPKAGTKMAVSFIFGYNSC